MKKLILMIMLCTAMTSFAEIKNPNDRTIEILPLQWSTRGDMKEINKKIKRKQNLGYTIVEIIPSTDRDGVVREYTVIMLEPMESHVPMSNQED